MERLRRMHRRRCLRRALGAGAVAALLVVAGASTSAAPATGMQRAQDAGCPGVEKPPSCCKAVQRAATCAAADAQCTSAGTSAELRLPASRSGAFTYHFEIARPAAGTQRLHAWVPLPISRAAQRIEGWKVVQGWPHEVVVDPDYGNHFVRLDLSDHSRWNGDRIPVTVVFEVTRWAQSSMGGDAFPLPDAPPADGRFLQASARVPIDGRIEEEARLVAGDTSGSFRRARLLYDHIVSTVSYDKSGGGWGRGDAAYACDVRKGNCSDFHSLFIAEARSLGIGARLIMGFPLKANARTMEIGGYHCWAEFYDPERGWVPLDASEAHKHPEKRDALFAQLDEHRIAFTLGRDIRLPGAEGGPRNYVIYPYVEVDGREHEAVETRFRFDDSGAKTAKASGVQTSTRL